MNTARAERSALVASTAACLLLGITGAWFAVLTGADAILLDGMFNLVYFIVGLFTLRVVTWVQRGDDERFPFGYSFFEPLVNGIKGLLVFAISLMALVGAARAFLDGGREIELGWAVVYGAVASGLAWSTAIWIGHTRAKARSPLVDADAKNWIVNAAISTAVLVAFLVVFLLQRAGRTAVVPYVDPAVVTLVVLVSIGVPVRMAWGALMALLNRAPEESVVDEVRADVEAALAGMEVRGVAVRVIQPGRTRFVSVHVLLAVDEEPTLDAMDTARERATEAARRSFEVTDVDLLFTRDERWFAALPEAH